MAVFDNVSRHIRKIVLEYYQKLFKIIGLPQFYGNRKKIC